MSTNHWLLELECLRIRYSELGVVHDVGDMSDIEKWGLYRFLKRYGIIHGTD